MGQNIPGLKDSLTNMLCDLRLQVSIQDGCRNILVRDYFNLHEKLTRSQQRALAISSENKCGLCRHEIVVKGNNYKYISENYALFCKYGTYLIIIYLFSDPSKSDVIVFNCRHFFHENCLPDKFNIEYCIVCKSKKQ